MVLGRACRIRCNGGPVYEEGRASLRNNADGGDLRDVDYDSRKSRHEWRPENPSLHRLLQLPRHSHPPPLLRLLPDSQKPTSSDYLLDSRQMLHPRLARILAYTGIKYSSATLAAGIGNLMPGFTFLLAVIFRMERLDLREVTSQAKSLGTVVAITGAMVMTLYQGPKLFGSATSSSSHSPPHPYLLSQNSTWVFGGFLFTFTCLLSSGWNILQTATLKGYPEQLTVVFFFCLFGTIQCVIYGAISERSIDAWVMLPSIGIIAIIFSAVFGTVFRSNVISWCLEKKGPLYVATFKPVGVIIAAIMEILFLSSSLHLGSVVGAIVSSAGFYTVLWGQAKEKAVLALEDIDDEHGSESSTNRAPLLR